MASGKSLKGYDMKDYLGSGSFGEVWQGVHTESGKHVAIKLMSRRKTLHPSCLENREQLLDIANISVVPQTDFEEGDDLYVISPLMPGSLQKRAGLAFNDPFKGIKWFEQSVLGLNSVHKKEMIHGHLKPTNFLLDENDEIRIDDLGQIPVMEFYRTTPEELWYVAPEMADPEAEPSVSWDIYALGAVFYHILTGTPPRYKEAAAKELGSIKRPAELWARYREMVPNCTLEPIVRFNPRVPVVFCDLIEKCLALDPEKRPRDLEQLEQLTKKVIYGAPDEKNKGGFWNWLKASRQRLVAFILFVSVAVGTIAVLSGLQRARYLQAEQFFEQGETLQGPASTLYFLEAIKLVPDERKYRQAIIDQMQERPSLAFFKLLGPLTEGGFVTVSSSGGYVLLGGESPRLFKDLVEIELVKEHGAITAAAFDPGEELLFVSGPGGSKLYPLGEGEPREVKMSQPCQLATFLADGKTLVTTTGNIVTSWDVASGKAVSQRKVKGEIESVGGDRIAAVQSGVRVQDRAGKTLRMLPTEGDLTLVALSPMGEMALTTDDKRTTVWEVDAPFMKPLDLKAEAVSFTSNQRLVLVDEQNFVLCYNTQSGRPTVPGRRVWHPFKVQSLTVDEQANWAVVVTDEGIFGGRATVLVESSIPGSVDWEIPMELLEIGCRLYSGSDITAGEVRALRPDELRRLLISWEREAKDYSGKTKFPSSSLWNLFRSVPPAPKKEEPKPSPEQTPKTDSAGGD